MSARVLITGASGGIGVATAEALRRRGATVIGLDLVTGGDDAVITCDVRDQASVDAAVNEAIERLGGLDVLINNAGLGTPQSAGKAPDDGALAVLDVNLLGPWRVTAAALPALRASRGRVLNVASGLVHMTVPFAPAYVMSKRGLVAYSDALRLEHGEQISVTTVYPGYIKTRIHDSAAQAGIGLEGLVPAEPVKLAARAITRAALGRPRRDVATSSMGAIGYTLMRAAPRGLLDRIVARSMRRHARSGAWDRSPLAAEAVARWRG